MSAGGSTVGRAKATPVSNSDAKPSRVREGFGVLVAAAGAYVLVSVLSYHPLDPSFNASPGWHDVRNAGGVVGAYLADVLIQTLGLGAYVVAGLLFATG